MLVESHQTISKIPFLQSALDQHNLWLKTLPSDHFSSSDIPVFPFFPMEYFCANLDSPFFPIKPTPNGWTLSVVSTLESDDEFADSSPHPQVFSGTFIYHWVPVTSPLRVFIFHHCPMPCSLLTALEAILSKPIPLHHEPTQVLQNLFFFFWHFEWTIQLFLQTPVPVCSDPCFNFHFTCFFPAILPLLLPLV